MNIKGIHHAAIICSDYEKSKDFYMNVLGCEMIHESYREERDSFKLDLEIGGKDRIELFSFQNAPERPNYPEARGLRHLAFEVENLQTCIKHLNKHGIQTEPVRVDEITNKRFTFFKDPDGLPLELYEEIL
ncbi:SMU1112c/YaeR family gloxylase I-like metalloprotein [Priestia endophytica]|jgi:glyoxylase I family protein|uniref:SMU1112c/YaeR family gloxylase I-like metalloprotein n=1 Tax=Priestia endophytica TaxID=135735 RepID=UPI002E1B73E5|nr:VOC family protein [Priestia endophytica]